MDSGLVPAHRGASFHCVCDLVRCWSFLHFGLLQVCCRLRFPSTFTAPSLWCTSRGIAAQATHESKRVRRSWFLGSVGRGGSQSDSNGSMAWIGPRGEYRSFEGGLGVAQGGIPGFLLRIGVQCWRSCSLAVSVLKAPLISISAIVVSISKAPPSLADY